MQTHLLENAAKVIPSTQILVNVISRRVRQLMNGHRPLVEVEMRMGLSDIALSEVIAGKLAYEHTIGFIPEQIVPRASSRATISGQKQAA